MIAYITCPEDWAGQSLGEIDVRNRFKVSILAIYRDDDIIMDLQASSRLMAKDSLLVLGHKDNVEKVENLD